MRTRFRYLASGEYALKVRREEGIQTSLLDLRLLKLTCPYPEHRVGYTSRLHTGWADLVSDIVGSASVYSERCRSFFYIHIPRRTRSSILFTSGSTSVPKAHIKGMSTMLSVYMMLCFGLETPRSFEVLPHRLEEDVYLHHR
jgi:hypothetical protein